MALKPEDNGLASSGPELMPNDRSEVPILRSRELDVDEGMRVAPGAAVATADEASMAAVSDVFLAIGVRGLVFVVEEACG